MVDPLNIHTTTPPTPGGGHTLTTTVNANTAQLRALTTLLKAIADSTEYLGDALRTTDGASAHAWSGDAADGFRVTLSRRRSQAYELAPNIEQVAGDIAVFTDEIDAVNAEMSRAKDLARTAGYRVTADMIQFPLPIVDPATSGISGLITAIVTQARRREAAAHTQLRTALAHKKTFLESLPTPARGLGVTRGLFTASTGTQTYINSAADRAKTITAASVIAENSTGALRQAAYTQLFGTAPWAAIDEAAASIKKPLTYGAVNWANLPTDPNEARYAKAFLKPLHLPGGVLGAAGTGLSIMQGTPPDKAIVTGGASWAAGAAASGVTEAALIALGVGAGPIGWATLAVGLVASAGVGYAVDQAWQ